MVERRDGPEFGSDAERKVAEIIARRRQESTELIQEGKSVREMLEYFDNDYTALEKLYREKTGGELLDNPYESPQHEVKITKTCSIVIPSYNNSERLENCLRAIQASTFNARYPQQMEVVVVDDGSPGEDIAERVEAMGLDDLNIKVLRQSNGQVSKGRYSGVLNASGDIVIITDPDIVYTENMIEEYMKRQQVLDGVVMFGLRDEIDVGDERLGRNISEGSLRNLPQGISADPRVRQDGLADSAWLKDGGHNQRLPIDADDDKMNWRAASIAWGMSVCAKREDFLRTMSGYDEGYKGYGGDDEDMVSRLMALGNYVIPNTGAVCYHQRHPSGNQDPEKHRVNIETMERNLNSSLKLQSVDDPQRTDANTRLEIRNNRNEAREVIPDKVNLLEAGSEELKMGNYREALAIFRSIERDQMGNYWYWYDLASALIGVGGKEEIEEARGILTYLSYEKENSWVESTIARAYTRIGAYSRARDSYEKAKSIYEENEDCELLDKSASELRELAVRFMKAGKSRLALDYFGAAAVKLQADGGAPDRWMIFDMGVCFERLGNLDLALEYVMEAKRDLSNNTWVDSRLGLIFEKMGDKQKAVEWYRSSLGLQADNTEALEGLRRLS